MLISDDKFVDLTCKLISQWKVINKNEKKSSIVFLLVFILSFEYFNRYKTRRRIIVLYFPVPRIGYMNTRRGERAKKKENNIKQQNNNGEMWIKTNNDTLLMYACLNLVFGTGARVRGGGGRLWEKRGKRRSYTGNIFPKCFPFDYSNKSPRHGDETMWRSKSDCFSRLPPGIYIRTIAFLTT